MVVFFSYYCLICYRFMFVRWLVFGLFQTAEFYVILIIEAIIRSFKTSTPLFDLPSDEQRAAEQKSFLNLYWNMKTKREQVKVIAAVW